MLIHRLRGIDQPHSFGLAEPLLKKCFQSFSEALGDDLNISVALAALFDLVREINSLCDAGKISREEASKVLYLLEQCDRVLGVLPLEAKAEEISSELIDLLARREKARTSKDWKTADECRNLLLDKGYLIEDTPSGARLKRKP